MRATIRAVLLSAAFAAIAVTADPKDAPKVGPAPRPPRFRGFKWTHVAYESPRGKAIDCRTTDGELPVKPFDMQESFAVECDFKAAELPTRYMFFLACGDQRGGKDPYLLALYPKQVGFVLDDVTNGKYLLLKPPPVKLAANRWYRIAGFYDAANREAGIILNERPLHVVKWEHGANMDRPMPTYMASVKGFGRFKGWLRNIRIGNIRTFKHPSRPPVPPQSTTRDD